MVHLLIKGGSKEKWEFNLDWLKSTWCFNSFAFLEVCSKIKKHNNWMLYLHIWFWFCGCGVVLMVLVRNLSSLYHPARTSFAFEEKPIKNFFCILGNFYFKQELWLVKDEYYVINRTFSILRVFVFFLNKAGKFHPL